MSISRFLLIASLLAFSGSALSQEITFKGISDGDTVDLRNLQILFQVNQLPGTSSRIWLRVRHDGNWLGGSSIYCQAEDGTFNYQTFWVEMVNLRDLGNQWCTQRKNVAVMARALDVSWLDPGTEIEFNVEFEWYESGWTSITKSIFLIAE